MKEHEIMQIRDNVKFHFQRIGIPISDEYEILLEVITLAVYYYYSEASYQMIYQEVAVKFGKTSKQVEKKIERIARIVSFTISDENLDIYFGNTLDPENKYLSATMLVSGIMEATLVQTEMERAVGEDLKKIGISLKTKGYRYLRRVIMIYIQDANSHRSTTEQLYAEVAEQFQTTRKRVEVAIEYAISEAHSKTMRYEAVKEYFPKSICLGKVRPTNVQVIARIKEHHGTEKEKAVADYLRKLGIPITVEGYYHLKEAILALLNDSITEFSKKRFMYLLSEKFGKKQNVLEERMREAVKAAYVEEENREQFTKMFGADRQYAPGTFDVIFRGVEEVKKANSII